MVSHTTSNRVRLLLCHLVGERATSAFSVSGSCYICFMTKMILTPTRAGLIYECVECGMTFDALSTIPPDHECMTVFSF
jgi:hypothetical protein